MSLRVLVVSVRALSQGGDPLAVQSHQSLLLGSQMLTQLCSGFTQDLPGHTPSCFTPGLIPVPLPSVWGRGGEWDA